MILTPSQPSPSHPFQSTTNHNRIIPLHPTTQHNTTQSINQTNNHLVTDADPDSSDVNSKDLKKTPNADDPDNPQTSADAGAGAEGEGLDPEAEEKAGSGRTVAELRYKPDFVRVIIPQFDAKSTPSYLVKQYLGTCCLYVYKTSFPLIHSPVTLSHVKLSHMISSQIDMP